MTEYVNPLPGQVLGYVADFGGSGDDAPQFGADVIEVDHLDEANVITSKFPVTGLTSDGVHRPIIDLDLRAWIEPSSTPGHGHLYIDHAMTWEVYRKLLEAMAEAGLISRGYLDASVKREATCVRLPWIKKDTPPMPRPTPEPFPKPTTPDIEPAF